MNPWIIVRIILWLACGFAGRCMVKYAFVKRFQPSYERWYAPKKAYRIAWPKNREIIFDIFVLTGLGNLIAASLFVLMFRKDGARFGLML